LTLTAANYNGLTITINGLTITVFACLVIFAITGPGCLPIPVRGGDRRRKGVDVMFKAAKQNRIFQDVVEQIQETILSGKLKPGEMLPSERELKAMLQVSRGTLREALRVLEQKGLIEIKLGVGGGAVVQDMSYDQMNESLALLIRYQKVSLRHLSEFRVGVEGRVSALAAARATPADIHPAQIHAGTGAPICRKRN
jgi:DNA-binding GntR family transcriptional regulator